MLDHAASGFWAIADGMGGHARGDVAATRVVSALAAVDQAGTGYTRVADLAAAVSGVNRSLFLEGQDGASQAAGATLVALLAHDRHFACLWAGDSRAYHFRDGRLAPLTRDHSHVQELVDAGALAETERRSHPHGHLVTRAVGAGPTIDLDRRYVAAAEGDRFLLCSDGLTACLDDDAIARVLKGHDLDAAADRLLAEALAQGAPDNVSLILIEAYGAEG